MRADDDKITVDDDKMRAADDKITADGVSATQIWFVAVTLTFIIY